MKKFIIALAAVAALSTSAFANSNFGGSDHSDGLNTGYASDTDVSSLPLINKNKLHTVYAQSVGNSDEGAIGYLTKNSASGPTTFTQQ